jgi:mono/diheme cytochrome c family protein
MSASNHIPAALLVFATLLAPSEARAGGDPARGKALLQERGCLACHTTDGSPGRAPTLSGLVGRTRRVVTNEVPREIVADEAYVRRSILEPVADVVEGYLPGAMPGLPITPAEADDLAAAIVTLSPSAAAKGPPWARWIPLALIPAALAGLGFWISRRRATARARARPSARAAPGRPSP